MKIEPITCKQSVYYLSYADKEQAMSEQVNIDIHQSKYDQYLVGFTQLFNIQEKHGRKHTLCLKFSYHGPLLANLCVLFLAGICRLKVLIIGFKLLPKKA